MKDPFYRQGTVEYLAQGLWQVPKQDHTGSYWSSCTWSHQAVCNDNLCPQGQYQTILCVLHCIVSLQTLPMGVEEACLSHAIKAFTKVNFDSENGPIVYDTLRKIFKHTLEEKRKMAKDSLSWGFLLWTSIQPEHPPLLRVALLLPAPRTSAGRASCLSPLSVPPPWAEDDGSSFSYLF